MELTFEQLPKAVNQLYEKLENIEKLLCEKNGITPEADQLLTIDETAALAHLSKLTIYGLVSRAEIPCMKKGKRLYFSKTELINWIRTGRKKTVAETAIEANTFVSRKGK
jgi:excisionase family DNA binding protein